MVLQDLLTESNGVYRRRMKVLTKGSAIFDGILKLLALFAAAIIVFVWLSVSAEVIMRYVLDRPLIWVVEVTEYALLYITFLGTAWLLKREGHVRIDLVLNRLNPRTAALLNTIVSIIGAIICLIFAWYSAESTWNVFQGGFLVTSLLQPPEFIILAIIPIGSFMLFIQFMRRASGYLGYWRAGT